MFSPLGTFYSRRGNRANGEGKIMVLVGSKRTGLLLRLEPSETRKLVKILVIAVELVLLKVIEECRSSVSGALASFIASHCLIGS